MEARGPAVGNGNDQVPAFDFYRYHSGLFKKIPDRGGEFHGERGYGKILKRDHGNLEMIPQHRQQIILGKESQLDNQPGKRRLLFLLKFGYPLHLLAREEPPFNQLFRETQMRIHILLARSKLIFNILPCRNDLPAAPRHQPQELILP
jgi:hypothetical protein